jgi:hypothetical protein
MQAADTPLIEKISELKKSIVAMEIEISNGDMLCKKNLMSLTGLGFNQSQLETESTQFLWILMKT